MALSPLPPVLASTLGGWCAFKMGPSLSFRASLLPWGCQESAVCVELGRRRGRFVGGRNSFGSDPPGLSLPGRAALSCRLVGHRNLFHVGGEDTQCQRVGVQKCLLRMGGGASVVAQWLRICLPMQGTRVRAPVWEDPTCHGATGPVSHNY